MTVLCSTPPQWRHSGSMVVLKGYLSFIWRWSAGVTSGPIPVQRKNGGDVFWSHLRVCVGCLLQDERQFASVRPKEFGSHLRCTKLNEFGDFLQIHEINPITECQRSSILQYHLLLLPDRTWNLVSIGNLHISDVVRTAYTLHSSDQYYLFRSRLEDRLIMCFHKDIYHLSNVEKSSSTSITARGIFKDILKLRILSSCPQKKL